MTRREGLGLSFAKTIVLCLLNSLNLAPPKLLSRIRHCLFGDLVAYKGLTYLVLSKSRRSCTWRTSRVSMAVPTSI
jgi:hypothetical protein